MLQCDTLARSRIHFCHDNATLYFFFFYYFCLAVAVNNVNVSSVAMEKQKLVSFAPLSNCDTFRTAVNITIVFRHSCLLLCAVLCCYL